MMTMQVDWKLFFSPIPNDIVPLLKKGERKGCVLCGADEYHDDGKGVGVTNVNWILGVHCAAVLLSFNTQCKGKLSCLTGAPS